jgi:hypothetical protein
MIGVYGVVRAYILADPAITAIIDTRFYPVKAPQGGTFPLVTMRRIVEPRFPHLRGPSGLAAPRYQLDAWTRETGTAAFTEALRLAELIRLRIDGFSGILTDASETPDARLQVAVRFDDARELFESDVTGGYYRQSTDYVITYRPVSTAA